MKGSGSGFLTEGRDHNLDEKDNGNVEITVREWTRMFVKLDEDIITVIVILGQFQVCGL